MHHLVGSTLPDVELLSSDGTKFNPRFLKGRAVFFCYPYTGKPGVANPRGWDQTPGAHGSTPQALAYAALFQQFRAIGASIFGLSRLSQDWIADFKWRNRLAYELLSDAAGLFSDALKLERFHIDGVDYLCRITLIALDGEITQVIYPVVEPAEDAAHVLALLK